MLTGELAPTAGEASLKGVSTSASLMDVFQFTGFCPQLKGLWVNLTLRQHLTLILRLKGLQGAELMAATAEVEKGYGLQEHAHKRAKKLSGGTQRKLSAAMALSCGSPGVVFVDGAVALASNQEGSPPPASRVSRARRVAAEPTTGVDVGTRRFIWDRIKEASKERVVVLTTHYMDEADALAQRIGIMAAGRLRVLGSPQHLKSRHGGGYRIELKANPKSDAALTKLVDEHFAHVKRVESHRGTRAWEVSQDFKLAKVFAAFEEAKGSAGLETYTMSQTTLEDVFLRVAQAHNPDAKKKPKNSSTSSSEDLHAPTSSTSDLHACTVDVTPAPDEMNRLASEFVTDGTYINGCWNVYQKIEVKTPQPDDPGAPAYTQHCWCCALEWIIPIPCCCCPKMEMVPQLADPDGPSVEEGAEVYVSKQQGWNKEKHTWTREGFYTVESGFGKETYRKAPCLKA